MFKTYSDSDWYDANGNVSTPQQGELYQIVTTVAGIQLFVILSLVALFI